MKELLTSFLFSTRSNVKKEKTISNGRHRKISKNIVSLVLLVCGLITGFTNIGAAQSSDPATATLALTPDLVVSEWKSPLEYAAVITSMKASTAKKLAEPNLQAPELALYTGFDRLLSYIQTDFEAHFEITKIAETNYNRVVHEAPSDPILINMQMSEFASLYDTLVNKLHQ